MHDRLSEVFEARSRRGRGLPLGQGGRWFCPGCGCPATTGAEHVQCPRCDEYLDEFIHGLVELHPHLTRLLLTVEDTFEIRGRGLVLAPFLAAEEARATPFAVELHMPDGTIRMASALAVVPFVDPPPKEQRTCLMLLDMPKSEVPVGTKIWSR